MKQLESSARFDTIPELVIGELSQMFPKDKHQKCNTIKNKNVNDSLFNVLNCLLKLYVLRGIFIFLLKWIFPSVHHYSVFYIGTFVAMHVNREILPKFSHIRRLMCVVYCKQVWRTLAMLSDLIRFYYCSLRISHLTHNVRYTRNYLLFKYVYRILHIVVCFESILVEL